jgi:hypothetical protein
MQVHDPSFSLTSNQTPEHKLQRNSLWEHEWLFIAACFVVAGDGVGPWGMVSKRCGSAVQRYTKQQII